MGPDTDTSRPTTLTAEGRCPGCRAAVRPDAPWCTQCWTDLRPPPALEPAPVTPEPVATPEPAGSHGPTDTPETAAPTTGGWPCTACGATNAVELDACADCGLGFLASMRADAEPLLTLPGIGDITRLSRAQRLGLAGGVVLLVVLLTVLVGLLFG